MATTDTATLDESRLRELEPALIAFARRAVGDPTLAADLVQEALVAAIKPNKPFEGRSKLRTWLIGILSHKITDHFRKQKREAGQSADDPDLLATSPVDAPDRVVARRQALDVLDRTLPTLPEKERLAVLMIDVEGLDREEVCNALDVTPTHLRVLLHRGRNRLRRALEDADLRPDA